MSRCDRCGGELPDVIGPKLHTFGDCLKELCELIYDLRAELREVADNGPGWEPPRGWYESEGEP